MEGGNEAVVFLAPLSLTDKFEALCRLSWRCQRLSLGRRETAEEPLDAVLPRDRLDRGSLRRHGFESRVSQAGDKNLWRSADSSIFFLLPLLGHPALMKDVVRSPTIFMHLLLLINQ